MAQWITDMNIVSETGRPQEVERLQLLSAEHSHESQLYWCVYWYWATISMLSNWKMTEKMVNTIPSYNSSMLALLLWMLAFWR